MSHWLDIAAETLIVAWLVAIITGLFVYWREKKRTADGSRTRYLLIVRCLLQIVSFAALFSLMGVLQRVNDAGLIADSLKWFLTAMVLLLVLAQALLSSRWLQVHQRND